MIAWKNLDTLAAYGKLAEMKDRVDLAEAMSGASGARRADAWARCWRACWRRRWRWR